MRLGELLLTRGVITGDQLRAALDAQRSYAGRLGTNLVRLGFLELDTLSRALGEQLGRKATQQKHVASIDKRPLSLFSGRVVASYKAIPLGYTTTKPARVIVACVDPSKVPVEELSFAAGSRVDVWIAPELMVEECLERYFGIPRPASPYIEVKFDPRDAHEPDTASDFPALAERMSVAPEPRASMVPGSARVPSGLFGAVPPPAPSSRSILAGPPSSRPGLPGLSPPPAPRSAHNMRDLGGLTPPPPPPAPSEAPEPPEPTPASAPRPAPPPPRPTESLRALPALTPPPPRPPPASAPRVFEPPPPRGQITQIRTDDDELPSDDDWDPAPASAPHPPSARPASARPASARPASARPPSYHPLTAPPEALRPIINQAEASQMLEMATSKEQIGRVLEDWLQSTFGCGLVLVVKGDMAVGWKGFFQDAEDLIEAVTVPLNKATMFSAPFASRSAFCGSPLEEGAKVHNLMWKLLRCTPPAEVIICPVAVGTRVVNLLYAHAEDGEPLSDTIYRQAQVLAGDAGVAYMRMIRRQQDKAR